MTMVAEAPLPVGGEGTLLREGEGALLREGDRLTRDEFERRYSAMPWVKKAELIEGRVRMASPVRIAEHSNPHGRIQTWIGTFEAETPGVLQGDNATVRLDAANEYQPDACLIRRADVGGQTRIGADGMLEGPPELVVEVAASSVSTDRQAKRRVYERCGVGEYLLWDTEQGRVDWWVRRAEGFVPLLPDDDGILRSEVFPGLWLDVPALLAGNMRRVFAVLREGLGSPGHAAYVASLAAAGSGSSASPQTESP